MPLAIMRRNLFPTLALLLVSLFFGGECSVAAIGLVPNGELTVAYRKLENGKLSDSVHHITLLCFDGECRLTTLTLNQCLNDKFYPKIEQSSTTEGNLFINDIGDGVLLVEEKWPETTFKFSFTFTDRPRLQSSKDPGLRERRWFAGLTGFSGAAVKQSSILNEVISWQLVPLKGRWPTIEANCKILLDGIPE